MKLISWGHSKSWILLRAVSPLGCILFVWHKKAFTSIYNKCKHYPSHLLWQCMIWAPTHPLAELMREYSFWGMQHILKGMWSMLSQVSGSGSNSLCLKLFWFEIKDCLNPGSYAVCSTQDFSLLVPISPSCYYKIFFAEHINSLRGKVWGMSTMSATAWWGQLQPQLQLSARKSAASFSISLTMFYD